LGIPLFHFIPAIFYGYFFLWLFFFFVVVSLFHFIPAIKQPALPWHHSSATVDIVKFQSCLPKEEKKSAKISTESN